MKIVIILIVTFLFSCSPKEEVFGGIYKDFLGDKSVIIIYDAKKNPIDFYIFKPELNISEIEFFLNSKHQSLHFTVLGKYVVPRIRNITLSKSNYFTGEPFFNGARFTIENKSIAGFAGNGIDFQPIATNEHLDFVLKHHQDQEFKHKIELKELR